MLKTVRHKAQSLFAEPPGAAAIKPGRAFPVFAVLQELARRHGLLRLSFLVCVVLPTLLGTFYTLLLVPNEYVAEFRVVVRSAAQQDFRLQDLMGSAMSSAASVFAPASDSAQNAFMVSDYVKSRNMVEGLGGKSRLLEVYSPQKGGRLSGLSAGSSLEDVWTAWRKKLRVNVDTGSGILSVLVRAYTPQDALSLAEGMIARSEAMVNDVSQRSRADALARAGAEVAHAQREVVRAHKALLDFRNEQRVIDPSKEAEGVGTLITGLTRERFAVENQRASMGSEARADSPVARLATARVSDINRQVAQLRGQLTARNASPAISSQLAAYTTLQLHNQFAEQMYRIAQAGYESARQTRERQQLYLMTVVRPSLPQEALYPRRAADIFFVFGACLILWSIVALIVAAILDHTA